jgi:hypothetical protein
MVRKGTKVEKIVNYLQQNPTAQKAQIEKGIGMEFSSSQLAVARKRMRAAGGMETNSNSEPLTETEMRRRLALDMITQHLTTINRLLMELR